MWSKVLKVLNSFAIYSQHNRLKEIKGNLHESVIGWGKAFIRASHYLLVNNTLSSPKKVAFIRFLRRLPFWPLRDARNDTVDSAGTILCMSKVTSLEKRLIAPWSTKMAMNAGNALCCGGLLVIVSGLAVLKVVSWCGSGERPAVPPVWHAG